jgi:chromatin remodeling complex protein RSC6
MVRQSSKADKTTSSVVAPVASVSESVPVQTAAPAKKEKAPRKEKAPAPAVVDTPAVVAAPAVVDAPVVAAPATETSVETSSSKLNEVNAQIQQITLLLNNLKNNVRSLEKIVAREQKLAQKSSKSSKKASGNRQPSGFVKPTRISDELAVFLGKTSGTEMARTEVSREINKYIKAHNLQLQTNRRIITPDTKLSALLKLGAGDAQLTYFNLQKYMKPHFIKATA